MADALCESNLQRRNGYNIESKISVDEVAYGYDMLKVFILGNWDPIWHELEIWIVFGSTLRGHEPAPQPAV